MQTEFDLSRCLRLGYTTYSKAYKAEQLKFLSEG